MLVNAVIKDNCPYGGAVIASGILFYCIQLYCDFSGGIDITRGVARLFGIDMAENFRRPIFATSLTDYWRRWHITLGAWMRDYVFYPISLSRGFGKLSRWARTHIGGTAGKIFATSLATFIVYFIIGIWHGANFRYIAFGLWNGVLITASLLLEKTFLRWKAALHVNDKSAGWRVFMTLRTALLVFIGRYFTAAAAERIYPAEDHRSAPAAGAAVRRDALVAGTCEDGFSRHRAGPHRPAGARESAGARRADPRGA